MEMIEGEAPWNKFTKNLLVLLEISLSVWPNKDQELFSGLRQFQITHIRFTTDFLANQD